jgi:hypothetical protein
MVEQGTHKPLDVGSNPTLATTYKVKTCQTVGFCASKSISFYPLSRRK